MKKITKLLMIISFMFIGINGVKAFYEKEYTGKCTLSSSTVSSCNYSCDITVDDESYLRFNYIAEVDSHTNILKHYILNDISSGSLDKKINFIWEDEKISVIKVENKLSSYPTNKEFTKSDKMLCISVIPTVDTSVSIDNKRTNEISIKADTSSTTDDGKKEEIDTSCGLLGGETSKVVTFLSKMFNYVKVIIPILIILLSIADFLKVIFSGIDDDMKKAMDKFIKRIIIAVVFILVPLFISIIINISGVTSQYSEVNDGLKAIFCVLK